MFESFALFRINARFWQNEYITIVKILLQEFFNAWIGGAAILTFAKIKAQFPNFIHP
jgi:hypothetical protein